MRLSTGSLLLALCLSTASGHTSIAGPPPAVPAKVKQAQKGPVKVDRAQAIRRMKTLSAADAERMLWKSDISGVRPAVRKGNQMLRQGRVQMSLPGIAGRAPHAIKVNLTERVGKGSGPAMKLSLADQTTGQDLTLAINDEKGVLRITTGDKAVVIKQNPDGTLSVGKQRCTDVESTLVAFEAALPQAFDLPPELVAAMFVVPGSPEAGDKMIWELAIRPLITMFREYLMSAFGGAMEWLVGFLEFWFGNVWVEAFCAIEPAACAEFLELHPPN